ncbi:MAG TPA: hypothetical protein VI916_07080 [Acidimicrobiia bacterium]|nr:hypothetical protein [Acidimicrobiia bacterium]
MPESENATPTIPFVLRVRPWPDPVIDTLGHDPRSLYAETFWLPTLGPTTFLLLRNLATRFEARADEAPFELPAAATSHALGLGPREGRNSPLFRSLERLVQFDLAFEHANGVFAVRRNLPPVTRRHARRLPPHLQAEHEEWMRRSDGPRQVSERRAKRAAFVLAELGVDADIVERSLLHMGFQPGVCRGAATWAWTRHRELDRVHAAESRHPSSLPPVAEDLDAA